MYDGSGVPDAPSTTNRAQEANAEACTVQRPAGYWIYCSGNPLPIEIARLRPQIPLARERESLEIRYHRGLTFTGRPSSIADPC